MPKLKPNPNCLLKLAMKQVQSWFRLEFGALEDMSRASLIVDIIFRCCVHKLSKHGNVFSHQKLGCVWNINIFWHYIIWPRKIAFKNGFRTDIWASLAFILSFLNYLLCNVSFNVQFSCFTAKYVGKFIITFFDRVPILWTNRIRYCNMH